MKTWEKVLLGLLVGVVALLAVVISLTIGRRPIIGPKVRALTALRFEVTPQRLERGRYLFNNTFACMDCHSGHDTSNPDHPVLANMQGAGEVMPLDDLPGRIVASNGTADLLQTLPRQARSGRSELDELQCCQSSSERGKRL